MNARRSVELCAHTTRASGSGVASGETGDRRENDCTASVSDGQIWKKRCKVVAWRT